MPNEISAHLFGLLAEMLYDLQFLTSAESDAAKEELEKFRTKVVILHAEDFAAFDFESTRIDEFYAKYLHDNTAYANLWKVMQYVFTLPHGQSHVERGFNINDDIMIVNMKEKSLVAQRLIYDHMKVKELKPYTIQIDNALQRSCLSASSKCRDDLNEKNKNKKITPQQEKNNRIKEEINSLKLQITNLSPYIETLEAQAKECYRKAGIEKDLATCRQFVIGGNDATEIVEKKKKVLEELQKAVQKLQSEIV